MNGLHVVLDNKVQREILRGNHLFKIEQEFVRPTTFDAVQFGRDFDSHWLGNQLDAQGRWRRVKLGPTEMCYQLGFLGSAKDFPAILKHA